MRSRSLAAQSIRACLNSICRQTLQIPSSSNTIVSCVSGSKHLTQRLRSVRTLSGILRIFPLLACLSLVGQETEPYVVNPPTRALELLRPAPFLAEPCLGERSDGADVGRIAARVEFGTVQLTEGVAGNKLDCVSVVALSTA